MTAAHRHSLQEKVAFLTNPASYPHDPALVDVKETHMSWVFLAGELVYKLKKPVAYPFLDFTTLESRRWNCLEEVRLNARLAEGVYLGTVPLGTTSFGELILGGGGEAVDWLVCMKRLPAERMLDELITAGAAEPAGVYRAAAKLMRFYKAGPPLEVSAAWVERRFLAEHEQDVRLLSDRRFDLDGVATRRVLDLMLAALGKVRPLLQQRSAAKVYVEGHGDLRPEHVCLLPDPVFIDCLEFNRDLRVLDPFDDVAYLALECERLGCAWAGDAFLAAARQSLIPPAPDGLVEFYRASRALLRARLALAHLLEPDPRDPQKWEPRARQYVMLAKTSLDELMGRNTCPP